LGGRTCADVYASGSGVSPGVVRAKGRPGAAAPDVGGHGFGFWRCRRHRGERYEGPWPTIRGLPPGRGAAAGVPSGRAGGGWAGGPSLWLLLLPCALGAAGEECGGARPRPARLVLSVGACLSLADAAGHAGRAGVVVSEFGCPRDNEPAAGVRCLPFGRAPRSPPHALRAPRWYIAETPAAHRAGGPVRWAGNERLAVTRAPCSPIHRPLTRASGPGSLTR
jgi:hypothetical protein